MVLLILLGSPALVLHIAHVVLSLRLVQVALDEVLLVLKLEDQRKDDEELLEDVLMGLARFSTVSIAVSPCDVARKRRTVCMRFPKSTIVSQFFLTGSGRWSACHCSNCEVNFGKLNVLWRAKIRQFRVSCALRGGKRTHLDVADVVLVLETASEVCRLGTAVAVCAISISVSSRDWLKEEGDENTYCSLRWRGRP